MDSQKTGDHATPSPMEKKKEHSQGTLEDPTTRDDPLLANDSVLHAKLENYA